MITIHYYLFVFVGVQLYLSSDNSLLPDYSLLKETQLNSSQGIWCQTNTNSSSLNVTWYLPNGTIVPTTSDTVLPVYAYNAPGQSGLLRTGLLGSYQGLYSCIISSEGNESSSLVAAVVRDTEYNSAGMYLLSIGISYVVTGGVSYIILD